MARRALAATIASTALLLAASDAGAAGSDADLVLFGKDPGAGKAFACYTRHYDAAHLAGHRRQNVRDMALLVSSFVDEDMGRQYTLEIGVRFRKRPTLFQLSGGCGSSVDGKGALACGIDCDGGRIDVRIKDANSILVAIPDGAQAADPNSGDDPPADAKFLSDDKVFRLDRTALPDCLPLASDDDKADISAAK